MRRPEPWLLARPILSARGMQKEYPPKGTYEYRGNRVQKQAGSRSERLSRQHPRLPWTRRVSRMSVLAARGAQAGTGRLITALHGKADPGISGHVDWPIGSHDTITWRHGPPRTFGREVLLPMYWGGSARGVFRGVGKERPPEQKGARDGGERASLTVGQKESKGERPRTRRQNEKKRMHFRSPRWRGCTYTCRHSSLPGALSLPQLSTIEQPGGVRSARHFVSAAVFHP